MMAKKLNKITLLPCNLFLLAMLGCSPEPPAATVTAGETIQPEKLPAANEVSIRWTSYGVPHVKANSWEGLGYGFAHAVATNTVCVLAKEMIVVRGEQAKYFGSSERNIDSDVFYKALLNDEKIDDYLVYGSSDNREMDRGYAAGYNHFIQTKADKLPASCRGEDWVKPIDIRDLAKLSLGVGIRYGLGRVTSQIANARPNVELATTDVMDLFVDPQMVGSNALAFGSELTDSGKGILLGNPHYPWHGASRFHMAHLTLPGEVDVMGAGLISSPRIAIGFTDKIAWTHTVSTALRFTFFRLDLVDGNPMAYRVGDEVLPIQAVNVKVETESGEVEKTVYLTHLGPVVASESTPWSSEYAYVMRDVNYENYRSGDQYKAIAKSQDVSELKSALANYQAAAFVNTIAADSSGGTLYADMSAIPNVSAELLARCSVPQEGSGGGRAITLNGSEPSCDWQVDAGAANPGLMPPSDQPSLITKSYVSNMNDSYWLSNPEQRLEGYSPIIGNEKARRSLRTRAGLTLVAEALASHQPISSAKVEDMLFSHRHYGAELFLDEILQVCVDEPTLVEACNILSNWDRKQDVDSVGAAIFSEFFTAARQLDDHFAVPFDVNDPVNTPRSLTIDKSDTRVYIVESLKTAVAALSALNIPLDAKWGDVQFALRNGEKIGIPGGSGGAGMFSVITSSLNPSSGGYSPITHGNSYIQTVTWNADGSPNARAVLTYSQSPEPDSPHYSDLTKLYSNSEWVNLPFSDAEIESDLVREETLNF